MLYLLEEHRQRALYHAYKATHEDIDTTLQTIEVARGYASGSARDFLDLLESRIRGALHQ